MSVIVAQMSLIADQNYVCSTKLHNYLNYGRKKKINNMGTWFFGDTLGLSTQAIWTFWDVDGWAVVKKFTETAGRQKCEPVAELLVVAVLQAGVLISGEVGGKVKALSTFSWLKAVISRCLLLAVYNSWNWRNDQVLVSNSDYGISNAFAALWYNNSKNTWQVLPYGSANRWANSLGPAL